MYFLVLLLRCSYKCCNAIIGNYLNNLEVINLAAKMQLRMENVVNTLNDLSNTDIAS
jgi:hypothetical protein